MKKNKFLYLPLEIVVREMDGKALLGAFAAFSDWTVVMGLKMELYHAAPDLPEGVFLLKSAVPGEYNCIKKLKNAGHKIYSLDEEGLVTYEHYLRSKIRYNDNVAGLLENIFFWGPLQYECFGEAVPNYKEKGISLGNPRIEFWKKYAHKVYEDQVQNLKRKYGKFVLFPTSFGIANHYSGIRYGRDLIHGTAIHTSNSEKKFINGIAEHLIVMYNEYVDFFKDLIGHFPDTTFIIRPHPSESHEVWDQFAKECPNVKVIFEGPITPWVLASECVFHYGSTTAIEANLMNIPVLCYSPPIPKYLHKFYRELTHATSFVTSSREETIESLRKILSKEKIAPSKDAIEVMGKWIDKSEKSPSYKRILNIFEKNIPVPTRELKRPEVPTRTKANIMYPVLKIANKIFPFRRYSLKLNPDSYTIPAYGKRKRLGLDLKHVEKIVFAALEQYNKSASLKLMQNELTISLLNDGLIMIKKENKVLKDAQKTQCA